MMKADPATFQRRQHHDNSQTTLDDEESHFTVSLLFFNDGQSLICV